MATAAASTAGLVNGSGWCSPAIHRGNWSFQCGDAGLPETPAGQHADRSIEVRQVVDGPPRRDHVDEVSVASVEAALGHGLLVATELGIAGREERSEAGDRAQRVDQPRVGAARPIARRRDRAQALRELGQRVGERGVEQVVVERTGRVAQPRRQDLALEGLPLGVVAPEQLVAQPWMQRAPGDVSATTR